jgi:hypothetical protein
VPKVSLARRLERSIDDHRRQIAALGRHEDRFERAVLQVRLAALTALQDN